MSALAPRTEGLFSPSLPNLQLAWDHTSLTYLKTCARKYQLAIIEGWQPKGPMAAPLAFGLMMHSVLEAYDRVFHEKPEADKEDILRAAVKFTLQATALRDESGKLTGFWSTTDSKRSRYGLVRALVNYIDKYHGEDMKTATLPNGKPAVELSFRIELPFTAPDGTPFLYCGHIDKVGEINSQLFIVERKSTTTTVGSHYFQRFSPSNQISGYTFGGTVLLDRPISGVLLDAIQLAEGFARPLRSPIHRNGELLDEWVQNLGEWLRLAQYYAERDYYPMNEESCHLYGGCQYRSICRMPKGSRQAFLESNYDRKGWDPLLSRGEDE